MSLEAWALNPLSVIDEKFEGRSENGNWIENVKDYFKAELVNDEIYNKIPYLSRFSLGDVKDQQVVKFRGMVQDILNPEYYQQSYEVIDNNGDRMLNPGAYRDELLPPANTTFDFDSPNAITAERQVYCLIPIPGENRWVKELLDAKFVSDISMKDSSLKRQIGDIDDVEEGPANKQIRSTNGNGGKQDPPGGENSDDLKHNVFPFVESNNISCLVKLYDDLELKLNDVVEIVGIIYVPMEDVTIEDNSSIHEEGTQQIKGFEIRIHCLHTRKLQHYNPLIDSMINKESVDKEWMRESRELLRSVLEEALLGDSLAVEYFILHLISSVFMRQDMLALGSFSLNLTGINESLQKQELPRRLFSLIQSITTHSSYLPMTLANINDLPFVPKKDYEVDRLCSGVLQLPANSHFVLDETKLSTGQLNSKGVQNITALGNFITWQKVDVDFKYYSLEQHSNVAVLILSEGKSICESNCRLKLNPAHFDVRAGFKRLQSQLSENNLKTIRTYLSMARLLPYVLSDDMKILVEEHFVASRKNSNNITVDDLHQLLVMGRMVALSCGEAQMTPDVWKSTQVLVNERNKRQKLS